MHDPASSQTLLTTLTSPFYRVRFFSPHFSKNNAKTGTGRGKLIASRKPTGPLATGGERKRPLAGEQEADWPARFFLHLPPGTLNKDHFHLLASQETAT